MGRAQRLVLEAASRAVGADGVPQWVTADDIGAGSPMTRSDRESLRRAMRTLAKAGHVDIGDVRRKTTAGYRWMVAVRLPPSGEQRAAEAADRADRLTAAAQLTGSRALYDRALEARRVADELRAGTG